MPKDSKYAFQIPEQKGTRNPVLAYRSHYECLSERYRQVLHRICTNIAIKRLLIPSKCLQQSSPQEDTLIYSLALVVRKCTMIVIP